jgi:phosphate transport system substrate-binding protein
MSHQRIGLLLVVLALSTAASCSRPADAGIVPAARPAGALLGAGATLPAPLYRRWFEQYQKQNPRVVISYEAVGSGAGVKSFLADAVDFGASDSAMSDDEISRAPHGTRMIPMTIGSVALAYNLPEMPEGLKLSREAYVGIFRGEITHWNDARIQTWNPRPLPHRQIAVVTRFDSSGTTFAFSNHLAAISTRWALGPGVGKTIDWPGAAMDARGNEGVAAMIDRTPGAIGYVESGFADKAGLSVAVLQNKSKNFIAPSAEAASAALGDVDLPDNLRAFFPDPPGIAAYPIVTFTWILAPSRLDSPEKAAVMRDLFSWCLTEGQKESQRLGYSPLPPKAAQLALAKVRQIQP